MTGASAVSTSGLFTSPENRVKMSPFRNDMTAEAFVDTCTGRVMTPSRVRGVICHSGLNIFETVSLALCDIRRTHDKCAPESNASPIKMT
jgi:hypothetical protein